MRDLMLQNLYISGSCIKMTALCRMSWQKYINAAGDRLDGQKQREIEDTVSLMVSSIGKIN